MTIRRPDPQLDAENVRLLRLLDHLLSNAEPMGGRGNQGIDTILLSDKETVELARHFDRLLQSRWFLEAIYFVDQIYGGFHVNLEALKAIFVAGTKRNGRGANIHSTLKWQEFLIRLGAMKPIWPNRNVKPMSFDHFIRMERRLLEHLRLAVRTRDLIMSVASSGRENHERLGAFDFTTIYGERLDRQYEGEESLFRRVRDRTRAIFSDALKREASAQQLAGLTTLIANSSVMFTTRDWGIAGTISTMCGAVPLIVKP